MIPYVFYSFRGIMKKALETYMRFWKKESVIGEDEVLPVFNICLSRFVDVGRGEVQNYFVDVGCEKCRICV
jgi:hypothetical protein